MKIVSIVLIEDNRIVRDVISRLIEEHADFTVRALSANVDDTLRIINDAKPEIVLLDSGLRDHDSLRLTARIHKQTPSVRIVVMGLLPHDSDITAFVQAGARGFIMKQAPFDEFMATLRAVALGEDALPRKLTSTLFDEIVQHMLRKARLPDLRSFRLTRREREVVSLVGEGLSNKEISARLHVAVHTVKSHIHNILEKLELRSRVEIAALNAPKHTRRTPDESGLEP